MPIPGLDPDRRRSPRVRPTERYQTDPPSAGSTRLPVIDGPVFDMDRIGDAIRQGLIDGLPPLPYPNDELLIATAVAHGNPRWSADQMRYHPGLRKNFVGFWLDVQLAAKGDKPAQQRVDAVKWQWQQMRRAEQISDIPDRATGYVPGDSTNQSPV